LLKLYKVKVLCSSRLPQGWITGSVDLRRNLNLNLGQQLYLSAGNRKVPVQYAGDHDSSSILSLCVANNIQECLMLPLPLTLNLAVDSKTNLYRLGPLVGIFANRFDKLSKPFGEQTSFFRKLGAAASRLNSFCFAFSPGDIDWDNKVIYGSIPPLPSDELSGWQTTAVAFPDVIYDRGLFPRGARRGAATAVRKVLRKYPGVKFFNPAFFGKWKTHRLLSKHEILCRYLPETRLYTSMADIWEMLARHRTVYIKPCGGSSGKGIIRITSASDCFTVGYRTTRELKTVEFSDRNDLQNHLSGRMGNHRYIIQQGLDLAKINGSPFDVRILMQKNHQGRWLRTGMAVRVAGKQNFITNLHAGGHAARISDVLPEAFANPELIHKILSEIKRLCLLIASWVSAEYNPLFGEIAVDLGINELGKVWIIELNAVPGRSVFRRIGATGIQSRAVSRPMEYASFLAGFTPPSNKD